MPLDNGIWCRTGSFFEIFKFLNHDMQKALPPPYTAFQQALQATTEQPPRVSGILQQYNSSTPHAAHLAVRGCQLCMAALQRQPSRQIRDLLLPRMAEISYG